MSDEYEETNQRIREEIAEEAGVLPTDVKGDLISGYTIDGMDYDEWIDAMYAEEEE